MIKTKIFTVMLFVSSLVHGQETHAEAQAIRCSALTFVFTSLASTNPDFATNMWKASEFFSEIFGAGRLVRTKTTVANGEVNLRRDLVLNELRDSWHSNPNAVVQEAALCQTWGDHFMPILRASATIKSEEDLLASVGEPPSKASTDQVALFRIVTPRAFVAWLSIDFVTPTNLRMKLRDSSMAQ